MVFLEDKLHYQRLPKIIKDTIRFLNMLSFPILIEIIKRLSFTDRKRLLVLNKDFSNIISEWKDLKIRAASFDIGKNNFAQYIEDFDYQRLRDTHRLYHTIDPKDLKVKTGESLQQPLLESVFRNGTRADIGVFDFQPVKPQIQKVKKGRTSNKLDNATRLNFLKHLYSYKWLWDTCDIFVVEQQFVNLFGRQRGINIDALKLGEATVMWFLEHYPQKVVKTFGSQYKTKILQAPKKMTKPQRKKWATVKALKIFQDRVDTEAIDMWDLVEKVKGKRLTGNEPRIQSYLIEYETHSRDVQLMCDKIVRKKQKLDDISDVVVQLQAYKYMNFVSCAERLG